MKLGLYSKILGAAALLALALPAGQARAGDSPFLHTYYGSGNPDGDWTITTDGTSGIEVGLRAVYRNGSGMNTGTGGLIVPDGSTYTASTGSMGCISNTMNCGLWNYNFSVDTRSTNLTLGQLNALLTITGPGLASNTPFNVLSINDNNGDGIATTVGDPAPTGTGPGGTPQYAAQNSENLIFPVAGLPGFNPWNGGTYHFSLDVYDSDDTGLTTKLASVQMTVNAVPEPASMALLGAGLLGLGLVRRRRHG